MEMLMSLFINGIAVYITANVLPGVSVNNFLTALIVSVVMGAVNAVIKPIFFFLTLPVTISTLGLFTFVINALMVFLVAAFVPGFHVNGFWAALFFSLVVSLVSSVLRKFSEN